MILDNLARLPAGFMEQIIEYRQYAATKQAMEQANTPQQRRAIRATTYGALAHQIKFDLVRAEIDDAS